MTAWAQSSVGAVCEVIAGQSPASSAYNERGEGLPFYQGKKDFTDRYLAPPSTWTTAITKRAVPNDILMSVRAPVGPINVAQQEVCIGRGLAAIRAGSEIDNGFLWYALLWLQPKIVGNAGAVFPSINKKQIEALPIPLPSLEEQKRIVAVLDQAFAALDRARANAEANLADAEELFEASLTALFSSNAAGDELVELSEIANLARGHNPPKKDFAYEPKEGFVRFYQIRDRKSDRHAVYVPDSNKLHRVSPNEILMTAYRHIGEVFRGAEGAFNVALCKLSSKSEEMLLNDYLYAIIPTNFVKGELLRHSERSLIPSMSIKHLQTIKIPLPDVERQRLLVDRFESLTTAVTELKAACKARIQTLENLRQSILHKAFAGELT